MSQKFLDKSIGTHLLIIDQTYFATFTNIREKKVVLKSSVNSSLVLW